MNVPRMQIRSFNAALGARFQLLVCPEASVFVFQLMSCGVYQRGEEDEGVFGFLVDDIKREIRRSARLVRHLPLREPTAVAA